MAQAQPVSSDDRRDAIAGIVDWKRTLAVCAVAGLFLALAGAFGTGEVPLERRLAYWIGLLVAGGLLGGAIARTVFGAPRFERRPWLACLIVALLLTVPLTLIVWAATTILFEAPWEPAGLVGIVPQVALVSTAMTAIAYLADHRPRETHAAPAGAPAPRFLDRLPPRLEGATLYAVAAEDHYLRIHTDRGSDLILMRLADAIGELEGIEGAQTHRSWWVAKNAVVGVERGDGRATFALKNGVRAPVSRTYARTLRAEGWY